AGASAAVDAAHCLFARCPDPAGAPPAGDADAAVLIRQADSPPGTLVYRGKDNRYYDLDGYWVVGDDWQAAGWRDFRKKVAPSRGEDSSRVQLSYPWQAEPAALLARLEQQEPDRAFLVKLDLRSLRQQQGLRDRVVGAQKILGERFLPQE